MANDRKKCGHQRIRCTHLWCGAKRIDPKNVKFYPSKGYDEVPCSPSSSKPAGTVILCIFTASPIPLASTIGFRLKFGDGTLGQ